jgi:hypothetical protein
LVINRRFFSNGYPQEIKIRDILEKCENENEYLNHYTRNEFVNRFAWAVSEILKRTRFKKLSLSTYSSHVGCDDHYYVITPVVFDGFLRANTLTPYLYGGNTYVPSIKWSDDSEFISYFVKTKKWPIPKILKFKNLSEEEIAILKQQGHSDLLEKLKEQIPEGLNRDYILDYYRDLTEAIGQLGLLFKVLCNIFDRHFLNVMLGYYATYTIYHDWYKVENGVIDDDPFE